MPVNWDTDPPTRWKVLNNCLLLLLHVYVKETLLLNEMHMRCIFSPFLQSPFPHHLHHLLLFTTLGWILIWITGWEALARVLPHACAHAHAHHCAQWRHTHRYWVCHIDMDCFYSHISFRFNLISFTALQSRPFLVLIITFYFIFPSSSFFNPLSIFLIWSY